MRKSLTLWHCRMLSVLHMPPPPSPSSQPPQWLKSAAAAAGSDSSSQEKKTRIHRDGIGGIAASPPQSGSASSATTSLLSQAHSRELAGAVHGGFCSDRRPRFLIPPRRFACKSNKRTNHVYSFFSNTKQDLDVKTPLITKDEIDKKKKKNQIPPKSELETLEEATANPRNRNSREKKKEKKRRLTYALRPSCREGFRAVYETRVLARRPWILPRKLGIRTPAPSQSIPRPTRAPRSFVLLLLPPPFTPPRPRKLRACVRAWDRVE